MKKLLYILVTCALLCVGAWVYAVEDNPNTPYDETRYLCSTFEVKKSLYGCTEVWEYSDSKRKQFYDSDRDTVKDFEDKEENTHEEKRRYVCVHQDIERQRFNCADYLLGVFSASKKSYLTSNGNLTGTPGWVTTDGINITNGGLNLDTWNIKEGTQRNDPLRDLQEGGDGFWTSNDVGERGIYDVLVTVARDIKNIFFVFATVFFLYIVLRLLLSDNTEEDTSKFKKWILWISIGIIVMQLAFSFVSVVYDGWLWEWLAGSIVGSVLMPLITLLETIAAFFFIAMAIVAFYRLITSNGEEQAATDAKTTVINALLWYIVVRAARFLVEAVYVKSASIEASGFSNLIVSIINWMNGFVAIVVILMILYTGAQVLLSWWEEEKLTNAKKSLIYIVIWVVLLLINFLILTFFFSAGI